MSCAWRLERNSLLLEYEVLKIGLNHKTFMRARQWAKEAYLFKCILAEISKYFKAVRKKFFWEAKL